MREKKCRKMTQVSAQKLPTTCRDAEVSDGNWHGAAKMEVWTVEQE